MSGSTEIVSVAPNATETRTYPVVEDAASRVSVKAPGMNDLTLSYKADCVQPPHKFKYKLHSSCHCVTPHRGEGVIWGRIATPPSRPSR